MFSDYIKIKVQAGRGGNGVISFRREKYIAKGGPDGGDGGQGGHVILKSDPRLNNLGPVAHQKLYQAEDGQKGANKRQHGANGRDIIISVPSGTIVYEISQTGKHVAVFDFNRDNQSFVIAHGGKGGFGNAHFTSSTRQTPRFCELGINGEKKKIILELKSIADIGIIGLPNCGKSTFLSVVTEARPKIADYPFTTIIPNLGVAMVKKHRIIMADIPGLIAGASQGKGLGHQFLRHVERTKALLHLINIQSIDPVSDYQTIRKELKAFSPALARKKEIICFTKLDTTGWKLNSPDLKEYLASFRKNIKKKEIFAISAITGLGLDKLMEKILSTNIKNQHLHPVIKTVSLVKYRATKVRKIRHGWKISGDDMERFALSTDFTNPEAVQRIHDIIRKKGIAKTLEKKGLKSGDKIYFDDQYIIW